MHGVTRRPNQQVMGWGVLQEYTHPDPEKRKKGERFHWSAGILTEDVARRMYERLLNEAINDDELRGRIGYHSVLRVRLCQRMPGWWRTVKSWERPESVEEVAA